MALLINVSHQHHVSFIRDTLILDMLKMEYSRRLSYSDAFQLLRRLFLRTGDGYCRHRQEEHRNEYTNTYTQFLLLLSVSIYTAYEANINT